MNYYKRHLNDYAGKAGHLSMLEHGAYNILIDGYYNRERGPTRAEALRWTRARSAEEVAAVDAVLAEFFVLDGENFKQARIEEELAHFHGKQEANRRLGALGGEANAKRFATDSLLDEEANGKRTGSLASKPVANSHEEAKAKQGRATRLPADWTLTPERRVYCETKRPDLDPIAVFEDFEDYWRAKPGKEATKTDWDRTWQKWVRNQRGPPPGAARSQPSKHLTGVAGFLGVNPHDLIASPGVVLDADRPRLGEPVPAGPRRLPGE